jgi:hypothetical protein
MKKIAIGSIRMFVEAWLWLAVARTMLILLPFRKLTPILGEKIVHPCSAEHIPMHHDRLYNIGKSILRAGSWSPWRTKCFEQALAAKFMLKYRRMASTVFFGVSKRKKNGRLYAHAWLESGGLTVTGDKHLEQFTVIACFKS